MHMCEGWPCTEAEAAMGRRCCHGWPLSTQIWAQLGAQPDVVGRPPQEVAQRLDKRVGLRLSQARYKHA